MITRTQLLEIMPQAASRIDRFIDPLNATMEEFGIDAPLRQAAFLAQIGHESGQLRYVEEIASGKAYEGRADLGNTQPGDGVRFKGRGLIQVTGRANYVAAMMALNIDCVQHPEVLQEPVNACRTAGWYWVRHGLNTLADKGDFVGITRRINGGINGLADRTALYVKAKEVLEC